MKCQHDFTQPNDSLELIPVRRMVTPQTFILKCKECGEIFTVTAEDIENVSEFIIKHTP